MKPLVVILGPTASGKSALAAALAKQFKGEIVSADSRQIYRGLDIGTGKVTKRERRGVPHHLLSIAHPRHRFSVVTFKARAERAIDQIQKRGKLPFLVGGTGLYIDAVARGIQYPEVPPNLRLRRRLEGKPAIELYRILQRLDPKRAKAIDRQNPRRLIRAIEIVRATRQPLRPALSHKKFDALFIGIQRSRAELIKRVSAAVKKRIKRGLIRETERLRREGISKKRLSELGLDYAIALKYLGGKISRQALPQKLEKSNWDYVKRQETWFGRYPDIHWVKTRPEASRLIKHFISRG